MVKDINGTEFGYISPVFTSGFYETFQSVQHGALSVAFSYLPDARTRLNLRTLNGLGAAPDSTFPFLGGIVLGNERLRLDRPSYTSIPLGGTCATPPSGEPRVFTRHNSHSANVDGKENYVESPIWRYDPGTNALTAQWINPDGSEPETTIMLSQTPTLSGLELTGDIDGVRWYARWEPGPSSFAEVTFTCVPLA
ncbi:hypothetical protein B0H19DRAFT_686098 [Mycena capillaripes]|nr:hypothetical protein B0H19DRAFT_686098 [Mycena capillaripes]